MSSIFDKVKLSPAQLRSAAGRRFDDAEADSVLSPDEQRLISMIVTVTPDEVQP